MVKKKNFSLINCIASGFLAYFFTVPFHEFLHLCTFLLYGEKIKYYSAGSVGSMHLLDISTLAPFHRVMVAGGSASIINAIIGVILLVILVKVKEMAPMLRLFLTHLMAGQLLEGFGYFLIGGLFCVGDWGNVFSYFEPGTVLVMRIILGLTGSVSTVTILYIGTSMTYYFIEDPSDKNERKSVSVRLNLMLFLTGFIVGGLAGFRIPEVSNGHIPLWEVLSYNIMWFIYFVAFIYAWAGVMVKPPKESRLRCKLPADPHPVLWILAAALVLFDIIVFGPGIYFN